MPAKTSAKAQIRSQIRQTLRTFSNEKITNDSRSLRQKLLFPSSSKVALFAGTATEPMLLDLIDEYPEVRWYLPKVIAPGEMEFIQVIDRLTLRKGPFNILEPEEGAKADSLDYIVCPGLAFTMKGERLGQGGGFYDRVLLRFPNARVLGVSFSCQIFENLPTENHDRKMDIVLTPDSEVPDEIPGC